MQGRFDINLELLDLQCLLACGRISSLSKCLLNGVGEMASAGKKDVGIAPKYVCSKSSDFKTNVGVL